MKRTSASRTTRFGFPLLPAAMAAALALFGAQSTSLGATGVPAQVVGSTPPRSSTAQRAAGDQSSSRDLSTQLSATDQAYAAREANAKGLEDFKGGDLVIVGSGGLVIVLLVILILVII
jgi:hypothetical protein